MQPTSIGLSPFVFRDGFSYNAYLEERSHFEDLSVSIDNSIARHVLPLQGVQGSLEQQTVAVSRELSHINSSLDGIADRIDQTNAALYEISGQISGLQDTLDDVLFSVQAGFRAMDAQMTSMNAALQTLIEIAKTPAQTWAAEQLSIGQDLLRRGLPKDALVHIDQALNGYGDHPGYRYWPLPHFLMGLILIGAQEGRQSVEPDLKSAADAFQNAATYADDSASAEARKMRLDSLCASGWCAYADGQMETALERLSQARGAFPRSAKAAFLEAKVHFNQAREDAGLKAYGQAIRLDPRYVFLAARDGDFQKYSGSVAALSDQVRRAFEDAVRGLVDRVAPFVPDSPHALELKFNVPVRADDLQVDGKPLSRLFRTRDQILTAIPEIEAELTEKENELRDAQERVDRVLARRPSRRPIKVDRDTLALSPFGGLIFGVPLALVVTVIYQYSLTQKNGGGFWSDFAIATVLCVGAIALTPIVKDAMQSAANNRKAEAQAASAELRAHKEKPVLAKKATQLRAARHALDKIRNYASKGEAASVPST